MPAYILVSRWTSANGSDNQCERDIARYYNVSVCVCVCDDSRLGCDGLWADAFNPEGELVGAMRRVRVMFGGGGGSGGGGDVMGSRRHRRRRVRSVKNCTTVTSSVNTSPRWQLSGRHGNECHLFDAALLFILLARLSSGGLDLIAWITRLTIW